MTVLTAAILDEERKEKVEPEKEEEAKPEDPAFPVPVVVKSKNGVFAVVRNRRTFARSPQRIFLFIITLIGLLCAIGGLCYGIYNFANLGLGNRHRVFCRVIEASPIRRNRIIEERANLLSNGRGVRLFNPSFMYARQLYSSSFVLVLADHDITVIKVDSRRQCFVRRRSSGRRMKARSHNRLEILNWYRHVEEGSYFPNLRLLRRKWMARKPHLSHDEVARAFHPRVSEFCKEMKIYRMVEISEQVGVIQYGGGLLPTCPLRKCVPCPPGHRYVINRYNCRTCECERKKTRCPMTCKIYCRHGYVTDRRGCPTCRCRKLKLHRAVRSADPADQKKESCEVLHVSTGLNPLDKKDGYELDDIKFCPAL